MPNSMQRRGWTSRICLQAGSVAMALAIVLAIIAILPAQAQTFTLLYGFKGKSDGGVPEAGLLRDAAGNLYGTTSQGGYRHGACSGYGCGTVFKLAPNGKLTVLHTFKGSDGNLPTDALISDKAGNLYGTTLAGGVHGGGTVFKVDRSGKETVLHSFAGSSDGRPLGPLVRDKTGNLYGMTNAGGAYGQGTVFKINTSGKETVLYTFTGGSDGGQPAVGGLIPDGAGNLYGTTALGGVNTCSRQGSGCGVVFKLDPAGKETVLYTFTGGADGGEPLNGLTRDQAGNLYGSAGLPGWGSVFMLDATGKESVLYTFTDGADGGFPNGGLVRDAADNLYGTATDGGSGDCHGASCGVIFKLDKTGQETVLYNFDGDSNGYGPYAGLIRDKAGNLYGTAQFSGFDNGMGTVFKLVP